MAVRSEETTVVRQVVTFVFNKGIDESQEVTVLPQGYLTTCKNWIPEQAGGLRTRFSFAQGPNAKDGTEADTYPTTSRKTRGLWYTSDFPSGGSDKKWWVVALINPDNADANELWVTDGGLAGSWFRIDAHPGTGSISGADLDKYPMAFGKSVGNLIFGNPEMANLKSWDLDETHNTAAVTSMDKPGRALAFHKNRMYCGGSKDETRVNLYFSAPGNANSWDTTNDFIQVGNDDGEAIEDLLSWQGQLIIAKLSSVWILTGASIDTYTLTRLDTATGARGRCLVATPNGLVILGESQAWMWRGGDPIPIGTAVKTTYAGLGTSPKWRTGAYSGGFVLVSGNNTSAPMLAWEVASGAWHQWDVGSDNEQLISLHAYRDRMGGGPRASTTIAPLNYADMLTGARSRDFGANAQQTTFDAITPDYWLTKMRQRFTVRQVWVRYRVRARDSLSTNSLTIKTRVDGAVANTKTVSVPGKVGPDYVRIDMGATGRSLGFEFTFSTSGTNPAIWDVEEVIADIDIEAPG